MELGSKDVRLLSPEPERTLSARTWAVATLAVLVLLGVATIATLRRSTSNTGEIRRADPYAAKLSITGVQMSEATNGTGGKATYVEGSIVNIGDKVVTAVLVQVTFATTEGTPYRETLPLCIIRTRLPYVDLQPISASPILPSQTRDFRLIFESVPANWDVKPPAIQVVHADLR